MQTKHSFSSNALYGVPLLSSLLYGQFLKVEFNFSLVQACLIFTSSSPSLAGSSVADYVLFIFTFLEYFTGDACDQYHQASLYNFFGFIKILTKRKLDGAVESLQFSLRYLRALIWCRHLNLDLKMKSRFSNCNISNVIHGI